ncbi:MAG TPA: DUF4870 domain-containing protein [Ignavibacteria bacterium]|nr:DUF4870 domain-containing protein [Ignavibacteria bacterium]HMR41961.1 DUF4870 domain-containing protein [Ignavibacteria bacterium]
MDNNTTQQINESTSDERLLGMLSHLSIFFGGIILPIILWATQKDKSKFVSYNSLLALFYHISYTVLIILYVIFMVVILLLMGVGFGSMHKHSGGDMPGIMIIFMIFLYAGMFLLIFAGIGYGIYLAIKTYQGKLVSIPFLGKVVYKKVYGTDRL